jgi:hypothetical protein
MQDRNGDHDSSEDCLSIGLTSHKRHSWRHIASTDIQAKTDLIGHICIAHKRQSFGGKSVLAQSLLWTCKKQNSWLCTCSGRTFSAAKCHLPTIQPDLDVFQTVLMPGGGRTG